MWQKRIYTAWGCLKHWRATDKSSQDLQKKILCIGVPLSKAWSFGLARGCNNTYWPINTVWSIRKAKKTSTEGDNVKGVNSARTRIQEWATAKVRIMLAAFEPGAFKYAASQECINNATVMTLRTTSSVEAPLCLHGSIPIATLARWIVLEASSGWFCHHSLTFSKFFSRMSCLGCGSFRAFTHFVYWVSDNDAGWLSTSQVFTEPGEISRVEGSKVVEAAGCPWSARPIGVVAGVELWGAVPGEVVPADLTLASSASSSRMRCWLATSADGWVGSQDWRSWATSLAMFWVASFWLRHWPAERARKVASLSKSTLRVHSCDTNSATNTVVPMLSKGRTKVSLPYATRRSQVLCKPWYKNFQSGTCKGSIPSMSL